MVHEIENFFGVYLLYNINPNPRYKGKTYIGFTVDPNRRINQHNKGSQFGGAKKTSGKGPWDMVLIVHGFPNRISALRFEWAWQNPKTSRRLRHVKAKSNSEKLYPYCFRVVCEMLRTSPWDRLPLTIRWLKQEYRLDFPAQLQPPSHMPLQYGPVLPKPVKVSSSQLSVRLPQIFKEKVKVGSSQSSASQASTEACDLPELSQSVRKRCDVCAAKLQPEDSLVRCVVKSCTMTSHTRCLARSFLSCEGVLDKQLLPVSGTCPSCGQELLWGDIIRYKVGCYQSNTEDTDATHWADKLQI